MAMVGFSSSLHLAALVRDCDAENAQMSGQVGMGLSPSSMGCAV
jgi:hypothetical protein